MIVPYEIAVKLKQLGFSKETFDYYRLHEDGNVSKFSTSYSGAQNWNEQQRKVYSAPTISEALQWIREKYKIVCAVDVDYYDGFYYTGKWTDRVINKFEYTNSFDEHNEAESALLVELLTYLEQKR